MSGERRQELLVIEGELKVQAPKGDPAGPFTAKQAKARAWRAKTSTQAAAPSRMAAAGAAKATGTLGEQS